MRLTEFQQQAVTSTARNLQIVACAGSGKTEALAQRVTHLLARSNSPLSPANIVAFTFTNKAAYELRRRIVDRARERTGQSVIGMADMFIGTIHSFCLHRLTTESPEFLKFDSLDEVRRTLYILHDADRAGLTKFRDLWGYPPDERYAFGNYLKALSRIRESDIVDHEALQKTSAYLTLDHYREQLFANAYLDFDEQLLRAVEALETDARLRKRLGEQIRCLLVDEYQDVNPVQERLIRLIHSGGADLCVVGDDDQTIYQWRGSSVKHIISFANRYDDVHQVRLEQNHRSSDAVITLARDFIDRVQDRLPKRMVESGAQQFEWGDITAQKFYHAEEEAEFIARSIQALHGVEFNDRGKKRGLTWSDMAVLVRINRYPGGLIADTLRKAGIPVVVRGQGSLMKSDEGRVVQGLFQYLADDSYPVPPTSERLAELWGTGRFGLPLEALNEAVSYACGMRELLQTKADEMLTLQDVFRGFLSHAKLNERLLPEGTRDETMQNFGAISGAINAWDSINFWNPKGRKFADFAHFLSTDARDLFADGVEGNLYASPDAVAISTVHRAKGCEWPVVFMPALTDEIFPAPQYYRDYTWDYVPRDAIADAQRYESDIDNEDRLFYVGTTRSKKFLHFSWAPTLDSRGNLLDQPSEYWNYVVKSSLVSDEEPDYTHRARRCPEPESHVSDVEISFTDLKFLLECPYQFKLKVLYGFQESLGGAMGFGKALHNALSEVHRRYHEGGTMDEGEVDGLIDRHLLLRYADDETTSRMRELALKIQKNYLRDSGAELQGVHSVERDVAVHLDGGITIKGRIDLVRSDGDGKVTLVDFKSNHRSQAEDVTRDQLLTYALGYRELTGQDAHFLETYALEERNRDVEYIDDSMLRDISARIKVAVEALRQNRMDPTPEPDKCGCCDVRDLCPASMALDK